MPDLFFEDFIVGAPLPVASLTVAAEDTAAFTAAFGPGARDPGDDDAGDPPLSGWHVASLGMRLLFDAFLCRTAGLGGPGIEEVTWPYPVRPGDTLRFTGTVVAARVSASRPAIGLVTFAIRIINQDASCVMTQGNAIMVARRNAAGARA